MRSVPPDFCAIADPPASRGGSATAALNRIRRRFFIRRNFPRSRLAVEIARSRRRKRRFPPVRGAPYSGKAVRWLLLLRCRAGGRRRRSRGHVVPGRATRPFIFTKGDISANKAIFAKGICDAVGGLRQSGTVGDHRLVAAGQPVGDRRGGGA